MKKRITLLFLIVPAVFFLFNGCVTNTCTKPGQIIWDKGYHAEKDAPSWTKSLKKAAKAVGVKQKYIPERTIVLIGVSKDLNNQKGARADALDNMLKKYAVYLKKNLDRFMSRAADNLNISLPNIDTAVGANRAVRFIPNQNYESKLVKKAWEAHGRRCLDVGDEPVYRVYVVGVIDRESRKSHIIDAAKETFKYALVKKDRKDKILQALNKLVSKSKEF